MEDLASEWGEEEYLLRPKESLDGNIQNLQGVDIFVMGKDFEGVPQRRENRSVSVGGLRMWEGLNPLCLALNPVKPLLLKPYCTGSEQNRVQSRNV